MKLEGKQRQGIGTTRRGTPANAILGWTFKEDVPDIRNTRVIDIYRELQSYGIEVSCFDPEADIAEVKHEYGLKLLGEFPDKGPFDAVILAVKHRSLLVHYRVEEIAALGGGLSPVIVDVKGCLAPSVAARAGLVHWQL